TQTRFGSIMNASNATRQKLVIAVDGPSGSGKSSISREAAKRLGFNFLDTGAMYRMMTLFLSRKNVKTDEEIAIVFANDDINFEISTNPTEIMFKLNGEDVSKIIRTEEVTRNVSFYSALQLVRNFLLEKQRFIINNSSHSIVVEGRDIGSVVVPNADLKIFITASEKARAERRAKELNLDVAQVLNDQKIRDQKDSSRKISPLIKLEDSMELDTSHLSFDQSVEKFIELVKNV
ncbi:MAG: (d)CMP kinase, partial [Actinomycetes bacterium]